MENNIDNKVSNKQLEKSITKIIESSFPLTANGKTIDIKNVYVEDIYDDLDIPAQREIKLNRKSLQNPIYATIEIRDEKTNKIISQSKKIKIGLLPKMTDRFTFVLDGNEYQTTNQIRRRSGIYSRLKQNGELEAEFNLERGQNFKMQLDPSTQLFEIYFENRKYRLYTLLNTLGVSDIEIEKHWGKALLEINKKNALNKEVPDMAAIYKRVYKKEPANHTETINGLREYFNKQTLVDSEVTELTLGKKYENVTGEAMLRTSGKLLNINKGTEAADDRDSLIYKKIYAPEDLLQAYFEKQTPMITRKIQRSLITKNDVREIVSSATFGEPLKRFFTTGDLSNTPVQTNPVTIISEFRKTSPMGTGGITSAHSITEDSRDVQPTHFGMLDTLATPDSLKVGISLGLASEVQKSGNDFKTPIIRIGDGKIEDMSTLQMYKQKIAFPGQMKLNSKNEFSFINNTVKVMEKGVTKEVPAKEVTYSLRSPKTMFSYQTNLIPFLQNTNGVRVSMGSKMIGQALPLENPDEPLVQVNYSKGQTYENLLGTSFLNPTSPVNGIVTKISDDYIFVKENKTNTIHKVGLYKNFPLNQDGYVDSKPIVTINQKVKKEQALTDTNYTKNGNLALGKNLTVAYMGYKGYNFEDGIVISQQAADKLSHVTMHKSNIYFSPKMAVFNKKKFNSWYPDVIKQDNFDKLDETGVIKIGSIVKPDEVISAYLTEKQTDNVDAALKKLDKYTFNMYSKNVTRWDNEDEGVVTDVRRNGRNIDIYIKATHRMREGDKIVGRYGNKGVVTKILPNDEAPRLEDGTIIDVVLSPEGVPGRMNIGQILETSAAEIAKKHGKPYIVNNFDPSVQDWSKKIYEEMKQEGLEPNKTVYDGKTGKPIETKIYTGTQYFLKLRHLVDKKSSAHSFGAYDVDNIPAGKGAQKIGTMELYALLGHGSKSLIRDVGEIKGRKNEEYWRDLQYGLPPSRPNRNFAFEKLQAYLKGAGVNTVKEGTGFRLTPLTDKDVLKMSTGELYDPGAMLIGKNLSERKGGLFDKELTGGLEGTRWTHIELAERIPNPMYEDAITKILEITEKDYNSIIKGEKEYKNKKGFEAIMSELKTLDINKEFESTKERLNKASDTDINKLNKKLRYLLALKKLNMTAYDAYTTQNIPVMPPVFRPVYVLPTGDQMVSDLNKHYRDIGLINSTFKNVKDSMDEEEKLQTTNELYYSVKALQGFVEPNTYGTKYKGIIEQIGESKTGFIQGTLWSKKQDLSGRSTVTVDPTLGVDEFGIPKEMAYEMYKPFVIRDLRQSGMSVAESVKNYEEKTPLAENSLRLVMQDRPVLINRAPSLHKHSIQAFKAVLVDGKSIKSNPLTMKGFNMDLDGDTASVSIPISDEAAAEARNMYPSKTLFKHGDNSLQPELAKDYLFGVYALSMPGKETNKKFNTITEAKKAGFGLTDVFYLKNKKMTLGQWYLNEPLPDNLKNYNKILTGKEVNKTLETIGKDNPKEFSTVINTWKDLGANYSYEKGYTISLTDFILDRSYRDKEIAQKMPAINKLTPTQRTQKITEMVTSINEKQKPFLKNMYMNQMLEAGTIGPSKIHSINQIITMPGLVLDVKGNPIDVPIFKSYGEGLDTASYWNSGYGSRKGIVDRAVKTQESGALNKSLLNVTRKFLVTTTDCDTTKGLEIEIDDKNVMDRALLTTIPGVGKRNDIINSDVINKARNKGISKLKVRSPLTCEAVEGVCQFCYGLTPDGQLPEIGTNVGVLEGQALSERTTQLTMRTFHSGGIAGVKGGVAEGFPRIEQILMVPEKLSGKATLSTVSGKVTSVIKNQTGGYVVNVNNVKHIIPPGLAPVVKSGDIIKKGDRLSEGVLKPQEFGNLKTHLEAQKYLVNELDNAYDKKFYTKSFETVIKAVSDNAEITKAPEDSGFYRGDKTSISMLNYLNKKREHEGLEKIDYQPYFKSIDTLNTDTDDWLIRISSNRVKAGLPVVAAKSSWANIKGKDPIPAYLYGEDFGKNVDPSNGAFY